MAHVIAPQILPVSLPHGAPLPELDPAAHSAELDRCIALEQDRILYQNIPLALVMVLGQVGHAPSVDWCRGPAPPLIALADAEEELVLRLQPGCPACLKQPCDLASLHRVLAFTLPAAVQGG
jgi:hypothetical protein